MKAICVDFRRAVSGRWFLIAILGSLGLLWIGLGPLASSLLGDLKEGDRPYWNMYLYISLTSSTSALTLPAISALPYSGAALLEAQANAGRYAMLRTGRRAYCAGKTIACLSSSMLGQLVPLMVIIALGLGFGSYDEGYVLGTDLMNAAVARLICAGIWGCLAGAIGMISRVSSAVYIAPLAISFALSLIGRRLLPKMIWLDPEKWLRGDRLIFLCSLLMLSVLFYFFILNREVNRDA